MKILTTFTELLAVSDLDADDIMSRIASVVGSQVKQSLHKDYGDSVNVRHKGDSVYVLYEGPHVKGGFALLWKLSAKDASVRSYVFLDDLLGSVESLIYEWCESHSSKQGTYKGTWEVSVRWNGSTTSDTYRGKTLAQAKWECAVAQLKRAKGIPTKQAAYLLKNDPGCWVFVQLVPRVDSCEIPFNPDEHEQRNPSLF